VSGKKGDEGIPNTDFPQHGSDRPEDIPEMIF